MFDIPTILTSEELLDKAFGKASRITEDLKIKNKVYRSKKAIVSKLSTITDIIDTTLNKYISLFPSFDRLNRFDYEIINIIIGIGKIRKSLGAIDWARKKVKELNKEISRKVSRVKGLNEYGKLEDYRRSYYGRVTSILKQVDSELKFLNQTRNDFKKLPTIDTDVKTIVVAGYPNVGKSLLVKSISSAKPKVAIYPFTTKQLNVGHLFFGYEKIQIIDTPGLLDRSMEERNKIERQAVTALEYLADIIVFILDPSEHCGYTLEEQERLLDEIKRVFQNIEILVIENKVDLLKTNSELIKISAINGFGSDVLVKKIQDILQSDQK